MKGRKKRKTNSTRRLCSLYFYSRHCPWLGLAWLGLVWLKLMRELASTLLPTPQELSILQKNLVNKSARNLFKAPILTTTTTTTTTCLLISVLDPGTTVSENSCVVQALESHDRF
jgi:hypothetical protein